MNQYWFSPVPVKVCFCGGLVLRSPESKECTTARFTHLTTLPLFELRLHSHYQPNLRSEYLDPEEGSTWCHTRVAVGRKSMIRASSILVQPEPILIQPGSCEGVLATCGRVLKPKDTQQRHASIFCLLLSLHAHHRRDLRI